MAGEAEPASLVRWLRDRVADSGAGFDVEGWDASVWILHRMYEHIAIAADTTWDEVRKRDIATGRAEPMIVGDVNFDEGTTATGIPLGGRSEPGSGWRRLGWTELAQRVGVTFDDAEHPPCDRWFPYKSWPARISPPTEGSMERADVKDLIDVLSAHSPAGLGTPCACFFAALASNRFPMEFDETDLRTTTLGGVLSIYDEDEQSPSNIWPEDRSWFVYTDWDLQGTRVSGPTPLIDALIASTTLETVADSSAWRGYTLEQAARILGISAATVASLITDGQLSAIAPGVVSQGGVHRELASRASRSTPRGAGDRIRAFFKRG